MITSFYKIEKLNIIIKGYNYTIKYFKIEESNIKI